MLKRVDFFLAGLFALSVANLIVFFLTAQIKHALINRPGPRVVVLNLSDFSGRVLPHHEVRPGTFTISQPFGEAVRWGEDSILTFHASGFDLENRGDLFQVWRPDPHTENVFQYAESGAGFAWWGGNSPLYKIERLVFDENTREMVAHPSLKKFIVGLLCVAGIISVILFLVGAGCCVRAIRGT